MFYSRMPSAQFGPWDIGPQHGFARTSRWQCSSPPTTVSVSHYSMRTVSFMYMLQHHTLPLMTEYRVSFCMYTLQYHPLPLMTEYCYYSMHILCHLVYTRYSITLCFSWQNTAGDVEATFTLTDSEATRAIWNHKYVHIVLLTTNSGSL